jgi:hypothetical protein
MQSKRSRGRHQLVDVLACADELKGILVRIRVSWIRIIGSRIIWSRRDYFLFVY